MRLKPGSVYGVILFMPTPHHDDRGLFTRTFDVDIAARIGVHAETFVQDSQSRSRKATIRGLHGRLGTGEAKLVRCARGAVYDVVVDARPDSLTFGSSMAVQLDDITFVTLYIPPGLLHGFQVLTDAADVCYRIDRPHDPTADVAVRYDDPDLGINWPLPAGPMSERDQSAGSWAALVKRLHATEARA